MSHLDLKIMTKTTTRKSKTIKVKVKPLEQLPTNPFAFEVLDLVSRQRTKAKKIEVLRTYAEPSLKLSLIHI